MSRSVPLVHADRNREGVELSTGRGKCTRVRNDRGGFVERELVKVYWMDDTIPIPNINLVKSARLLLQTTNEREQGDT